MRYYFNTGQNQVLTFRNHTSFLADAAIILRGLIGGHASLVVSNQRRDKRIEAKFVG